MRKLGEIFDFINGRGFKKKEWESTGLPIIRIQNLNNPNATFNYYNGDYDKKIEVNNGELLFSWSGTVGSSFGPHIWIRDKGVLNQHIFKLTYKEKINKYYAFYGLKYITEDIEKKVNGAVGLVHITKEKLKEFKIPVPPLKEQKQIVKKLDDAFEAIDKAKANAEKNLANVKELFDSYLNNIFSNPGDEWEKKRLGDICSKIGSGATPTGGKKSYKTKGISLIRSLNIHDCLFKYENLAFIDDRQAEKLSNVTIESNDVLLNITGASIARCSIVPEDVLPARVNQHVSIIRLNQNVLLSKFLHYMLVSKSHKDRLLFIGEKNGATRQALTKSLIENHQVSFPGVKRQKKIIKDIEYVRNEVITLELIYEKKIICLEELKKSILKKAFEGEV